MINLNKNFSDTFYKRNPALVTEHSIPVKIARYFTDVDGQIVDKATVPNHLQTKYPVYLLAQFDREGGYKKSISAVPPMARTFWYMTFVQGINSPFLSFTGFNTIKGVIRTGDIVEVFTDDLENPSYFVWFIISAEPVSIASILSNVETTQKDGRIGQLFVKNFNYVTDNDLQYFEPLLFSKYDNIGNYRYDQVQPYIYKTPFVEQSGILTIDVAFKLDQYIGISTYFLFTTDEMTLTLKVNQI